MSHSGFEPKTHTFILCHALLAVSCVVVMEVLPGDEMIAQKNL